MKTISPSGAGSGSAGYSERLRPEGLRRQASRTAAVHLLLLLLFFSGLARFLPAWEALAGGAVAALVLALVHGLLWRHLPENRPCDAIETAPRLGTANHITLLRGLLISLTAGFLFAPPGDGKAAAWLPGSLYLAAALLDGVDGAWARKTRTRTLLGEVLDVRYDALGVLVASAVAVGTHRLPVYYLAAGGAYYVFQLGLRLRRRRGKPLHPAGPRAFARLVAGFQMGFLSAALLPLFSGPVLALAAPVFLLPLLAGFIWDWLIAAGRIGDAAARRGEHALAVLATKGPLVLRGFMLIPGGIALFSPPAGLFPGSRVILAGLVLMVAAGFLGRTAALLLSLLLACQATAANLPPWLAAMMVAGLLIAFTGTGALSLWRPEDALLLGKAGGPQGPRPIPDGTVMGGGRFARVSVRAVSGRRAAGRVAALVAVAGLLYWAWRDVPLGAVAAAVGLWNWPQWGLFALLNLFVLAAMCWRWSLILRRMGHPVGFAALMGYRMGANTLSYITPGPQFGGEPFQAHCLVVRHRVPAEAATASVVVDRLVELLGNLIFLSLAGLFVLPALLMETHALLPVTVALFGVVFFIVGLLYAVAVGGRPFSRLAGRAASWIGRAQRVEGLVAFLRAGESQAAGILTDRLWGWYALGGFFQWSGFLAELWLIYAFMGMPLSPVGLLTVAVAARLAFLLPLPGGLGALEAGQMLAITSLGGDPAVAAAACGIMRARDLVLISSGGVLAARWMRPPRERPARPPLKPA
jgi:CDP-diacylglycerol---glycerol-3-phosphate 3-phosphatidyltransferase